MVVEFAREKKCFLAFTTSSCSSQWFTTLSACYSTRCLLNLLENERLLHSMHNIAFYVYCVNHNFIFYMFHHFLPQLHLHDVLFFHMPCVHHFLYQLILDKNRRLPKTSSENIKYYHSCSVSTVAASATCAVMPRRPRMRSFAASAARNLARAHGTVIP